MALLTGRARHKLRASDAATPEPAPVQEYVVQPGDTLSGIARQHRIATAALLALNGLSWSSGICAGQRLAVPALFLSGETAPISLTGEIIRHHIQAGETVSAIAEHYGITRAAILSANGLHPTSMIFVNQVLLIPAVSIDTRASVVVQAIAG